MKAVLKFCLAIALMFAASLFGQVGTSSLNVTPVGTPTITPNNITPPSNTTGNTIMQYVAVFNTQMSAVGGDVTLGLPSASSPAVTTASFTIYKNGVPDASTNYTQLTIAYTSPSGTTVSANGSSFTIPRNSSVQPVISFVFTVTNGGTNVYGVKFNQIAWQAGTVNTSTSLTGTGWTAGLVQATPPVVSTAVPQEIKNLRSTAHLAAAISANAKRIEAGAYSTAQQGGQAPASVQLNGPGSQINLAAAFATAIANMKVTLTRTDLEVYVYCNMYDADGKILMWGTDYKKPVTSAGGYKLPDFKVQLGFNGDIFVPYKDAQVVKLTTLNAAGDVTGIRQLEVNYLQGFMFPPQAAGNGLLEVVTGTGVVTYDLQKGIVVNTETLGISGSMVKANTVSILDGTKLDMFPVTHSGIGYNILGEVTLTKVTNVSVAAITTELGNATSVTYRQVSTTGVVTGETKVNLSNGLATISLGIGHWQVIAEWPANVLTEPPFVFGEKGDTPPVIAQ